MKLKTIDDIDVKKYTDLKSSYKYQRILTPKLDKLDQDFDQDTVNQIVLWKVDRYTEINDRALKLVNQIKGSEETLDEELTANIIIALMEVDGIRLPMASTILRFKNPKIYQILDQRVYRLLYGKIYKPSTKNAKNKESAKEYIKYLHDLKNKCAEKNVDFSNADRILYQADKAENKGCPLK